MIYDNILALYFDQDQEREDAQARYERDNPDEADIIPYHKPWTDEQRAAMDAAVERIQADVLAKYSFKGGC